jgi:predicted CXXCH cytochrome family protein
MRTLLTRLVYGLLFAIPLMLVTYAFAQAGPGQTGSELDAGSQLMQGEEPAEQAKDLDCQSCHPAFFQAWQQGTHGKAGSDPAFRKAWQEAGTPPECLACHVTGYDPETNTWKAAGVTCERCHSPIASNHPAEPMPVDKTGALCGECHTETYFQWQASAHRENDLECSVCHDPHTSSLKAEQAQDLCASCHKARSSNFSHTAHSQKGLDCAGCHMADLNQQGVQAHGEKDHSFFVSLTTCNNCHVYDMHDPVAVHVEAPTPTPDPMSSAETLSVVAVAKPVNPIGFAILAGILGLAAGVVVAPLFERFQNKVNTHKGGD